MKIIKTVLLSGIIATLVLYTTSAKAQSPSTAEVKIKTSAVCESCKATIEKALSGEKGVKKSNLDVNTKIASVTYYPSLTTPDKIRTAIANSGYDADNVKANPKAYKNLKDCCKKENN